MRLGTEHTLFARAMPARPGACLSGLIQFTQCRKPKKGDKGTSAMQPVTSAATEGAMRGAYAASGSNNAGDTGGAAAKHPGSTAFAALSTQDVKAEDVFFHRYVLLHAWRVHVCETHACTALGCAILIVLLRFGVEQEDVQE